MNCPVLGAACRIPCGLRGCDLWVDNPQIHNCAVHAFGDRSTLPVPVIAELLGLEASSVKSGLDRALTIMREAITVEDLPRKYTLLRNHHRCIACRRAATMWVDGWGYCSQDCLDWLPPLLASLEATYGLPIPSVLASSRVIRRLRQRQHDLAWQYAGIYLAAGTWRRTPSPWRVPAGLPSAEVLRRRLRRR